MLFFKKNHKFCSYKKNETDYKISNFSPTDSNKIKQINGAVFEKLRSLTAVNLEGNECINENFHDSTKIKEMPEAVTAKCGFEE